MMTASEARTTADNYNEEHANKIIDEIDDSIRLVTENGGYSVEYLAGCSTEVLCMVISRLQENEYGVDQQPHTNECAGETTLTISW